MLMIKNASSWQDIKKTIKEFDNASLLQIIADLYKLNKNNQHFLHARFAQSTDMLLPYKAIIRRAVCPEVERNQDLRLSDGRRAIRDYKKASGNAEGLLELMVYYVECGNEFTLSYGDIDESFYYSVESVFDDAVKLLITTSNNNELFDKFMPRLRTVVQRASGMGWGYYDAMAEMLSELKSAFA